MTPERWQQVGKHYQAALALPPDEREAFLDDACVGDTALRREVESLLGAEERAGSFLAAGAMKDVAKMLVEDKSVLGVRAWHNDEGPGQPVQTAMRLACSRRRVVRQTRSMTRYDLPA